MFLTWLSQTAACLLCWSENLVFWLPPAFHACFLLQTAHVINHVKWQKAPDCQDCEGDLMELKIGCFVMMQYIFFHLGSAR